jgi:thiamine biosynthesis lipoprotein
VTGPTDLRIARASASPRTVHVEHCMGTVFSIDIRDAGDWTAAIAEVVTWLHRVDAVFSTYRADSDISRLRRGEVTLAEVDPDVRTVLDRCAEVSRISRGFFTATPSGRLDPTGLVKGWAIDRASDLLRRRGSSNHAVNGGGDIQLVGEAAPGRPWGVGISDPHDRQKVLAVVRGRDLAVASSGTAERGAHIVDPRTGRPAEGLAGVSVIGPRLTDVDAYATAAFAMGPQALGWLTSLPEHEGLVVTESGEISRTPGWPAVD